jgi:hypothetical protein
VSGVAVVAAFRAAEPRQLLVWLEAHRALGVAHFLLAPDAPDAPDWRAPLQPYTRSGAVRLLNRASRLRWRLTETAALQLGIARLWGGQIELLHAAVRYAMSMEPRPRWLANVDTDEVLMPGRLADASLSAGLASHGGALCVVIRRHNFAAPTPAAAPPAVANASSALAWASRFRSRAPFPPPAPLKGHRAAAAAAGGALSQPAHPKWLLNIDEAVARRATHADSPDLVAVNQHAILNAAGCAACTAAGRRAHNQTELPFLQSMLLAALAPFALGFADFNAMVLLDNTTAACEGGAAAGCGCQFPQRGCEARFHQWPPEKQRVLSCFSPAAAAALGGGGRAAPCWRPACLSGDVAEASVRVHHFGWHTFAPSSQLVDDDYASEWARARFPLR